MKIKSDYKLRTVAGETIVVNQGEAGADLTRIISLNASARLLWEKLADKEFTVDEAAQVLAENYGISQEQAVKDATTWVDALKGCGVI